MVGCATATVRPLQGQAAEQARSDHEACFDAAYSYWKATAWSFLPFGGIDEQARQHAAYEACMGAHGYAATYVDGFRAPGLKIEPGPAQGSPGCVPGSGEACSR